MLEEMKKDFKALMKKYNIESYLFYGQEDDDSEEYYIIQECSNLMMMKIFAKKLFMDDDFEITRDYIISEVLRYIDPQRPVCKRNNKGECEEIPFIPDCLT